MAEPNELSEREREILHLVARGASNKEIARDLHISQNTVKVHLRNIFSKVSVNSRTEAAMYAVSSGLVEIGPNGSPAGGSDTNLTGGVLASTQSGGEVSESARRWNYWIILGVFAGIILIASVVGLVLRTSGGTPDVQANQPIIPENPRWQEKAPLYTPRRGLALTAHQNLIYAIAGQTSSDISGVVERYDPEQDTWESISPKSLPVTDVSAAVVGGLIYVPGGEMASGEVSNVLEIYDPQNDTWTRGSPLPTGLSGYALSAHEGKLYLFGGWDGREVVDYVYLYDPDKDAWSKGTPMPTARAYPGVGISEGKVYVIGGYDGENALATSEIYSPDSEGSGINPWQIGESLPQPRYAMGVASLAETLHVIGGIGDEGIILPSLEYSPGTDTWEEYQNPIDGQWSQLDVVPVGTHLYLAGGEINGVLTSNNLAYQAIYLINLPVIR